MSARHYLITAEDLGNYEVIAGGLPDFGPDGLYVVRNGVAVAVTVEGLYAAMRSTASADPHKHWPAEIIAALTRPADGADE